MTHGMREDGLKCRKIRGNAPKVCVCRMGGMVDRDMEGKKYSWLDCLIFPGTPGTLLAGQDVKTGRMDLHRDKTKVCIVHTYSPPLSRTKTGEAQIRGRDVRDLWVVARGK